MANKLEAAGIAPAERRQAPFAAFLELHNNGPRNATTGSSLDNPQTDGIFHAFGANSSRMCTSVTVGGVKYEPAIGVRGAQSAR
jgi:hypothetical protein